MLLEVCILRYLIYLQSIIWKRQTNLFASRKAHITVYQRVMGNQREQQEYASDRSHQMKLFPGIKHPSTEGKYMYISHRERQREHLPCGNNTFLLLVLSFMSLDLKNNLNTLIWQTSFTLQFRAASHFMWHRWLLCVHSNIYTKHIKWRWHTHILKKLYIHLDALGPRPTSTLAGGSRIFWAAIP